MEYGYLIIGAALLMIGGSAYGLMYYSKPESSNSLDKLDNLFNKANSSNTRFRNIKELTVAKTQAELLIELNNVGSQLVRRIEIETQAVLANERLMNVNYDYLLERERIDGDHKAYLALTQNKVAVANMASDYGTTPEIMGEVILIKARQETELDRKKQEIDLEVERKRRLDEVEVDTHQKKKKVDIDAAHEYEMKDYKTLTDLQNQLSRAYQEQEDINDDPDISEWRRKKELQRVTKHIKALEKDVQRRQGLL